MRRVFLAVLTLLSTCAVVSAQPPWTYFSKEQEAEIRAKLPKFADERMQRLLKDAILYDSTVLPQVFFDPDSAQSPPLLRESWYDTIRVVRHNIHHTISAEDAIGSPNNEEPWKNTAGLPEQYRTLKALILPKTGDIEVWVGRDGEHSRRVHDLVQWKYPVGTTFLEFMYQKFSDDTEMVFNIRKRTKLLPGVGAETWGSFDQFRPVRNEKEFSYSLLRPSRKQVFEPVTLQSRHSSVFPTLKAIRTVLPPMKKEASKLLLSRPFKSTIGETWHSENGLDCDLVESDTPDSIVPVGYQGASFIASQKTCVRCHSDTQKHAFDLENPRPWYGYLRGSDGIFTWHPLDRNAIPETGHFGRQVVFDQKALDSGRVKLVKK